MDRTRTANLARTGGRLVAVLLPLAALAVLRTLSPAQPGEPPAWLTTGVFAAAAVAAGVALALAVVAVWRAGRIRDLGDATGLGMLVATFAAMALQGAGEIGLGIGVASAAIAFASASASGSRSMTAEGARATGIVVAFLLVEASLAAMLFAGPLIADLRLVPFLLAGAAVALAIAALVSLDAPTRATGLGIAASSALTLTLAPGIGFERLLGAEGIVVAAIVLGWWLVARPSQPPVDLSAPGLVAGAEPEFDEGARLSRELRGTLNDLATARRTIELQRAEIERATSIDPLTGLAGRTQTLERLRFEAAEARRYSHPVTILLLDVDHFAQLNHDYGLPVGDAILREVALRLRLRVREADALGRIGGDLFLAILPHTDEGGAASFAQALLDRLMAGRFPTERGELAVSVSMGIALMRPGMTFSDEELLTAAEEALASAKAAGGNRIAFDRAHGLARLDERRPAADDSIDDPGDEPTATEADATR